MSPSLDCSHSLYDIDTDARRVFAKRAREAAKYWEYESHRHRQAQLVFNCRGAVNCQVNNVMWVIPPNCAMWIPSGAMHSLRGWGVADYYLVYVTPRHSVRCRKSHTLSVAPLLKELIREASNLSEAYDERGPDGRLIRTLLDQLACAPGNDFRLPMPQDARIQEMLNILIEDPARKGTVTEWGERLGMSGRTLNRLLIADIGMSFSRWRRQLHLVYGLRRLIAGDRVQDIAHDFGYENASSFITMFRKTIGKSPGRFLTEDIRGTIE